MALNLGNNNPYEPMLRDAPETGGLPWRLFLFVLFILIIVVAAYLGLKVGYGPLLESRSAALDRELAELSEKIPATERDNFVRLYSQVTNLQALLRGHVKASSLFPILEKNTHSSVMYSSFDVNVQELRASVEGIAGSYEVLAQQLEAWGKVPQVTKYYISESQWAEGKVRFRLLLFFAPTVFNPNAVVATNS